jgi:hypothetical protein
VKSLAMMLGETSPPPGVIEVLTGSPFGFVLLGVTLPLFDPYCWTPEIGLARRCESVDYSGASRHRAAPTPAREHRR